MEASNATPRTQVDSTLQTPVGVTQTSILGSTGGDTLMGENSLAWERNLVVENGYIDPGVLSREKSPEKTEVAESVDYSDNAESLKSEQKALLREYHLPTGCCYDDRMKLHANADFSSSPAHPEDPRRIEAIMREFKEGGLIYTGTQQELQKILADSPNRWLWRIAARRATEEEICTCHTAAHYDWVTQLNKMDSYQLRKLTTDFDSGRKSLYVGSLTYEAALISAGGAIETCKNVVAGQVKNAIAIIRPPGHHAEHNESMGFCIFNNVPIAAKVCMADYPEKCRRVLILDWDVHHGNGIQNMFYNDPNVLYISIHVYQNGIFYPGQPDEEGIPDGGLDSCGAGPGVGKNINIGWDEQGMGDGEYMAAFQRIVMPIAREFDPDLVIVSAGFDAAAGDELGGCYVTPECYSHMTYMLMSLANGKVAVCLEGGYNLAAISRSALAVAKTLMGEPPKRITIPPINSRPNATLENVKQIQAAYWNCMRSGVMLPTDIPTKGSSRGTDILRNEQEFQLARKYFMVPLYIQRNGLSKAFNNQVLVTPQLFKSKRILMVIHDPPSILAQPNLLNNTLHAQNIHITDGLMPYIDWAVKNGFAVVDVNFPFTSTTDTNPYAARLPEHNLQQDLQKQTRELLCYIWDNYLETIEGASITLMGVGDAYAGIKQLLASRDIKTRIPSVLSFVSGSLRPVKSDSDPFLPQWYRANSLIYVSPDHACWFDEDSKKKVRKQKFGRVEKGRRAGLRHMLNDYEQQSFEWIGRKVQEWEALNSGRGSDDGGDDDGDEEMRDELA